MRTTLDLDPEVLAEARALAAARRQSLGKIISELARKGLAQTAEFKVRNGMPVFEVAPGTPRVSARQVKELIEDER